MSDSELPVSSDASNRRFDRERVRKVKPEPTEEELAAMVAAIDEVWPRPTVEENVVGTAESVWKFANRWWQGSRIGSRTRPRRPSTFG